MSNLNEVQVIGYHKGRPLTRHYWDLTKIKAKAIDDKNLDGLYQMEFENIDGVIEVLHYFNIRSLNTLAHLADLDSWDDVEAALSMKEHSLCLNFKLMTLLSECFIEAQTILNRESN